MKNKKFIEFLPIKTERLIILPTTINDIELILKQDKQEKTQFYLGGIKEISREDRISFLQKKNDKFKSGYVGSLTVYLESVPIGFVGFVIDEINNNAEISYVFDIEYTGRGYCIEVCKKIIELGFNELDLKRIYADTIEGNEDSKKLLEKLGFKHEGTKRKQAYVFSLKEYKDVLNYGILNGEYKQ